VGVQDEEGASPAYVSFLLAVFLLMFVGVDSMIISDKYLMRLPISLVFSRQISSLVMTANVSSRPRPQTVFVFIRAEACDKTTHEYIGTHRHQRSISPDDTGPNPNPNGTAPSRSGTQDLSDASDAEPIDSHDSQKFKLTLRSALNSKDVTLTVRPTTTCGAIIKAFLKSAGLSDKYPGLGSGQTPKKGGVKGKTPMLCLDGDKLDPGSEIGEADLEDGDLVEVVGL